MIDLELDMIWENLPFPAFVINKNDSIARANTASQPIVQTSSAQMANKPLSAFFGVNSVVLETLRQAREQMSSVAQYGVDIVAANRKELSCNLYITFLDVKSGLVLLILQPTGVAQKMSQSLTHMNAARSVSAMASTLAHEIRNPLAGISGAAQLLAMNADEEDAKLAEMIEQESKRIGTLVDRVELFGDQRPSLREPVNIHDILDRAVTAAQAGYGAHVSIRKDFDPSLPEVVGDFDQLMQVFQNLIKNASEAVGDQRGIVRLRTSYASGVKFAVAGGKTENLPIQVEVIDNGKGIPDNLINDIFDPFVSSKSNGTGLGLSLVSKLVAAHGGLIECDSNSEQTRFSVRLPVWTRKESKP